MAEHQQMNEQNVAPVKEIRARSSFDLSHYIFGTHRFGQYNVGFARTAIGNGIYPLRASDTIDSYTLKAPLMQDVSKTKEFFFVPKQCILPLNWDKLERLPALGDDVNASLVNSTVDFGPFISLFITKYNSWIGSTFSSESDRLLFLEGLVHRLLLLEMILSQGSLLAATGTHLASFWRPFVDSEENLFEFFDDYFDYILSLFAQLPEFVVYWRSNDSKNYLLNRDSLRTRSGSLSWHRFLELARDDMDFKFTVVGNLPDFVASVDQLKAKLKPLPAFDSVSGVLSSIDRCAAYQIVCAHYFSNDSIDYIHDADTWRQNMFSLLMKCLSHLNISLADFSFSYNGVSTMYDTLSSRAFSHVLSTLNDGIAVRSNSGTSLIGYVFPAVGFLINLFNWRRSLRFGDYFVGSKARPLAVGDFSVAVNDSKVDVLDVTKKLSLQRLANNVNRIGNSIKEWYAKIMGVELSYDFHNPMWLASTRSKVYAMKNENTNNADVENLKQVNTSANFSGRDSDFEFDFRCDRNGEIIGITYYDIRRSYSLGIQRMLQHVDRFDGFIPDMQYIGDQDIKQSELVASALETNGALSYTLRNMEYKQYYDEAYGGFAVNKLPGFAFLYKPSFYFTADSFPSLVPIFDDHISPEFIRSRCDEFDDFYVSLSGFSNASYFHFIVATFNDSDKTSLPMVFAPQIL